VSQPDPAATQGLFRVGGNHQNSREPHHVEHIVILPRASCSVYESMVPIVQYFRTSGLFRRSHLYHSPELLLIEGAAGTC
jgi:hypothetical protein